LPKSSFPKVNFKIAKKFNFKITNKPISIFGIQNCQKVGISKLKSEKTLKLKFKMAKIEKIKIKIAKKFTL
jgi:hypothetical protein